MEVANAIWLIMMLAFFGHDDKDTVAGTEGYKAQNISMMKPFSDYRQWDWYSFGMVLLEVAMAADPENRLGYSRHLVRGASQHKWLSHANAMELLSSQAWLPIDARNAIASLLAPPRDGASRANLDVPAQAEAFMHVFKFQADKQDMELAERFLSDGVNGSHTCEATSKVCCYSHSSFMGLGLSPNARLTYHGCEGHCGAPRDNGAQSMARAMFGDGRLLPTRPRGLYACPECDRSCTPECVISEIGLLPSSK